MRRDTVLSGKRRDAAGRSPTATEGRDKFNTGGVAARLWCAHHGANRSCPVLNFSPVKQVNIRDRWYKSGSLAHVLTASCSTASMSKAAAISARV